jgi:putative transposase
LSEIAKDFQRKEQKIPVLNADTGKPIGTVKRLTKLIPETQTDCFAWALISNHVHLLLRTGSMPISVLMSRLLTGYAGWFNKKYKRHGQLFQNRYKSILCQEDTYLKNTVHL